jgi:hypothetical protein
MSEELNSGRGRCHGTARLLIKPVRGVIELGALQDVVLAALNAVHHANRTGEATDFLAVALPQMAMGRDVMRLGHEIEVIGSEASLARMDALEGIQTLRRRGMIEALEIAETWPETGATGAAYIRDRAGEKHTPGWIRRSKARALRREKPLGKSLARPRANDESALALFYGQSVLHVREVVALQTEAPLMVSTFGFSSPSAPAILPVLPDSARIATDAA